MKFLVSKAFLAVLLIGAATTTLARKVDNVDARDVEEFAYWRGLVEEVASIPTEAPVPSPTEPPVNVEETDAPIPSPPVSAPTDLPVATPTDPPVAPVVVPTDIPVAAPTDPPVAPVVAPTAPPAFAPTDPPVAAPTDLPVAAPTDPPVAVPTVPPLIPTDVPVAVPTDPPLAPTNPPVALTQPPSFGMPTVQMRLTPFTLNNGAEFSDPNSYQSQALLKTEAQAGVETFTDEKLTQYYALYCIYNATNQVPNAITSMDPRFDGIPFPRWLVETGWDQTTLDPCDGWFGITCDAQGRVSTVDLFENLLTGIFPPEVALLALDGPFATGGGNLFRIDVFRNQFLFNNNDNSWFTDLGSNMSKYHKQKAHLTDCCKPRMLHAHNSVSFFYLFSYPHSG